MSQGGFRKGSGRKPGSLNRLKSVIDQKNLAKQYLQRQRQLLRDEREFRRIGLEIDRQCQICVRCGNVFAYYRFKKFCDDCRVTRKEQWDRAKLFDKTCVVCGSSFQTKNSITKCCTKECGYVLSAKCAEKYRATIRIFASKQDKWCAENRKRRAILNGVDREPYSVIEVFENDGWICGICGNKVDKRLKNPHPMSPSIDHIVPISKGGADVRLNVQCAHLSCNSSKCNRGGGQVRLFYYAKGRLSISAG